MSSFLTETARGWNRCWVAYPLRAIPPACGIRCGEAAPLEFSLQEEARKRLSCAGPENSADPREKTEFRKEHIYGHVPGGSSSRETQSPT